MKAKSQGGKKEEVVVDETIDYEIDENNQSTGVVNVLTLTLSCVMQLFLAR